MKRIWRIGRKGVWAVLLLYLLYSLIGSTAPWLPGAPTYPAGEVSVEAADFLGVGEGPDRALLIEEASDAMNVRLRMIEAAARTLDVTYYAIGADACGEAFLGAVLRAAERGVSVRVLVDAKFSGGKTAALLRSLDAHPNIECRRYNPTHLLKPWKWQAVLHDKFILADGQYLLLGGRNVSDRFFAPAGYDGEVTRDRDVFVSGGGAGSVCGQVAAYMEALWGQEASVPFKTGDSEAWPRLLAATEALEHDNPAFLRAQMADYIARTVPTRKVTLVRNPTHTRKKQPAVAQTMHALAMHAQLDVTLQTPYTTASRTLMRTLHEIDSNADTTLLTNSLASTPNYIAFSNYHSQRQRFLDVGLDIFELQSTDSIHGKSMIVDRYLSVVGSFNMDDRSFFIDTESMLVVDSEPFAQALGAAIDGYIAESLMVGQDNRYITEGEIEALPVSVVKRAAIWVTSIFSRLFSYLV